MKCCRQFRLIGGLGARKSTRRLACGSAKRMLEYAAAQVVAGESKTRQRRS